MLEGKGLLGQRDESLVSYDASYEDNRIGKIVQILGDWKESSYSIVYDIKNKVSLASMKKEDSWERKILEECLYRLKLLDINFLKELINMAENNKIDDGYKVRILLDNFELKRKNILRMPEELKSFSINIFSELDCDFVAEHYTEMAI